MAFEVSITAAYTEETLSTKQNSTSDEVAVPTSSPKTQEVVPLAYTLRIT